MTHRSASQPQPATARRTGNSAAVALDLRERRYPPLRIALAMQTMVEAGLSPDELLHGCGLAEVDLLNPDTRVSSLQFFQLIRNASRLYPFTDGGLQVGRRFHASCYGMVGYALLCSGSLREVFDTTVRYYRLGSGMLDITWHDVGPSAFWRFPQRHELPLPDLDPESYAFLLEFTVTALTNVVRDAMGPWCDPIALKLSCAPQPHAQQLEETLRCTIHYRQPANELHYPAEWLNRAPQLANAITAAQTSQACARMLSEFKRQIGITRQVYTALAATPGRFPDVEAVAASLSMTSRTLRRKLEVEGTSFTELLDGVRHALALDYLIGSRMNLEDIAAALGFSESATFRRAFRRWTGKSPSSFRN